MARIYDSILDLIGDTPLVRPARFTAGLEADLLLKLESLNPMSSVKDRTARAIIEDAMTRGLIKEKTTVIEATSGNTGVGLALVCAAKGIRLIVTMPESMSVERRKIIAALGGEVVLTEASRGMRGAIARAEELREELGDAVIAGQFVNQANPAVHRRTTGPEIWNDTDGDVDILVAGVGTGGTITGAGRYLKEKKPALKVVAVEPSASPILSGGSAGPHKIQGIGAGFIPDVMDIYVIDEIIQVTNEDAFQTARRLCKEDGLMVGISSGAAAWAARQLAMRPELCGQVIVAVLASHGERYLSTELYS
jgi:cysteine synthase A